MIKHCFKFLTLLCLLPSVASAQPAAVRRVLELKYDQYWPYVDNGTIHVKKNGKHGYVDSLGRELIAPVYDDAVRFRQGRAAVCSDGKWGLIDRTGFEVAPFAWEKMGSVYSDVAVAWRHDAEGKRIYDLVDTLGRVTSLDYDYCSDFTNGYAVVGRGVLTEQTINQRGGFKGKKGFITTDGREIIAPAFDDARDFGRDTLAAVGMQGKYYMKWGFADRQGRVVIPCIYYSVDYFFHGLSLVGKVLADGSLGHGYIDHSGCEVIPCRYTEATRFVFKNTWVGNPTESGENAYTLIDRTGRDVLGYPVRNLQDGGKLGQAVAAVPGADGVLRYGILDNTGIVVLPFEYDEITIFSERDPDTGQWKEAAMATKNGKRLSFNITKRL